MSISQLFSQVGKYSHHPPSLICIKYIKQPKGMDQITPIKYVFCLPSSAKKKFLLDQMSDFICWLQWILMNTLIVKDIKSHFLQHFWMLNVPLSF